MSNHIIRRKNTLSPKEIAESDLFRENLRRNMNAALRCHKIENSSLDVEFSPGSEITAYTNGTYVHINAGNRWFTENPEGKPDKAYPFTKKVYGAMFHELGHMFYTSFKVMDKTLREFSFGVINTGTIPLTPELVKAKKSLSSALKDNRCGVLAPEAAGIIQNFILKFWSDLNNCLEDGRIERLLLTQDSQFSGLCEGLIELRSQHYVMLSTRHCKDDGSYSTLSEYVNLILLYAKYRTIKNYHGGFEVLDKSIPFVDAYYDSYDPVEAAQLTTCIVLLAYMEFIEPFLVEIPESEGANASEGSSDEEGEKSTESRSENGSGASSESESSNGDSQSEVSGGKAEGGSDSSSSQGNNGSESKVSDREKELSKTLEDAKKALSDAEENASQVPKNPVNPADATFGKGSKGSGASSKDTSSSKEADDAGRISKAAFDKLAKDIAKELVSKDMQKEANEETEQIGNDALSGNLSGGGSNRQLPYDGVVCASVSPEEYAADHMLKSVRSKSGKLIKRSAREIQRHYETDQYCGVSKHRYAGKKFLAGNVVRNDYRYFESRSIKRQMPKLAAALCVDESGSMARGRIPYAREAAICLYDLIREVDHTDLMVLGHTTTREHGQYEIKLFPYMEFGEKPKDIARKLTCIGKNDNGGNFDSVPLRICAEKLLRSSAEVKLLIMITDGLPNGGSTGKELLREAVKEYRRKGIEIIGAAVGDDTERLKDLYHECRFLDIQEVDQLPRKMVNIIRRRL